MNSFDKLVLTLLESSFTEEALKEWPREKALSLEPLPGEFADRATLNESGKPRHYIKKLDGYTSGYYRRHIRSGNIRYHNDKGDYSRLDGPAKILYRNTSSSNNEPIFLYCVNGEDLTEEQFNNHPLVIAYRNIKNPANIKKAIDLLDI